MDVQRILAAIAEPTRYRILELLAVSPRTVGEVATELGALQPQTSKHLQAMELAGVITVHRLGRRRVVSLRNDVMGQLAEVFGGLATESPNDGALETYGRAIAGEEARLLDGDTSARSIRFEREIAASPSRVWRAWTDPDILRQWWAPEHFDLVAGDLKPVTGSPIRHVLREGDGAEYVATGRMIAARPNRELEFELSPLDDAGAALFTATYGVRLEGDTRTALEVEIRATDLRPEAASAFAGLEVGFPQLLTQLAAAIG